jgi:NOL1/NOP2/sun family putative RNA methylase
MQLPGELLHSLQNVQGFDEAAFKAVHESGEQVTSIRINPKKIAAETLHYQLSTINCSLSAVPWCSTGFYLSQRPSFTLDPLFHAGAYYVQEASSMFLWHVLHNVVDKDHHKAVLDLCAAPGGKSTLLSSFFTEGLVVSNEVIKSRVNILEENITKWGDENVIVTNNDSKDFSKLRNFFDVIVTDVPCSGSGLFRRDPSAIEEWSLDNVNLCCQRQQRILADIIPSLKQEGILIYSTCSYSKEEDEEIMDWIVDEFQLTPLSVVVNSDWNIIQTQSTKHKATGYRFFPDKLQGEGFFITIFQQHNEVSSSKQKEANLTIATAKERQLIDEYVLLDEDPAIFKHGETFNLFPNEYFPQLKQIANHLYIKKAGVALGSFKGKSFVPEHALALSNIEHTFQKVQLSKDEALEYLSKQDIKVDALPGWCLVQYEGLGLGWIKILPNRINNYYPSEWRILKS